MNARLLAAWEADLPDVADLPPVFEDRVEDDEETELARVDSKFHLVFGRDETTWEPREQRAYVRSIEAIHDTFHPQEMAA
jgi:hypothetical protein